MAEQTALPIFDRALTPAERRRLNARPKWNTRGYAARPGSGPAGETCGSCRHLVRRRLGKVYRKCALMQPHWTGGVGTDVLARAEACQRWEAPHVG